MPKINNSTETILSYLNRGGKVERIEDNAQRNRIKKITMSGETLFEENSVRAGGPVVDIPLLLRSPNGTLYELIVDDFGNLSTVLKGKQD